MRIVLSPAAADDLCEAYGYIAADNVEAAETVVARIVEVIGLLAASAFEGREVVLRDGRRVRTWPVPPYRIYYREREEVFEVLRIYHQARRPIER